MIQIFYILFTNIIDYALAYHTLRILYQLMYALKLHSSSIMLVCMHTWCINTSGSRLHKVCFFAADVMDVAWSPHDVWLASCSVDNTIVIWNARKFPGRRLGALRACNLRNKSKNSCRELIVVQTRNCSCEMWPSIIIKGPIFCLLFTPASTVAVLHDWLKKIKQNQTKITSASPEINHT